jgi:hypothetical protein
MLTTGRPAQSSSKGWLELRVATGGGEGAWALEIGEEAMLSTSEL